MLGWFFVVRVPVVLDKAVHGGAPDASVNDPPRVRIRFLLAVRVEVGLDGGVGSSLLWDAESHTVILVLRREGCDVCWEGKLRREMNEVLGGALNGMDVPFGV